jgi:hypothetical protein
MTTQQRRRIEQEDDALASGPAGDPSEQVRIRDGGRGIGIGIGIGDGVFRHRLDRHHAVDRHRHLPPPIGQDQGDFLLRFAVGRSRLGPVPAASRLAVGQPNLPRAYPQDASEAMPGRTTRSYPGQTPVSEYLPVLPERSMVTDPRDQHEVAISAK